MPRERVHPRVLGHPSGVQALDNLMPLQRPVRQDLVKQVAQGPQPEHLAPSPPAVLLGIVEHVAPLAERREVAGLVVTRVVIQMRTGQNHVSNRKS